MRKKAMRVRMPHCELKWEMSVKKTVEDIDRMTLTAFSADYSSEKKVFHGRETQ